MRSASEYLTTAFAIDPLSNLSITAVDGPVPILFMVAPQTQVFLSPIVAKEEAKTFLEV